MKIQACFAAVAISCFLSCSKRTSHSEMKESATTTAVPIREFLMGKFKPDGQIIERGMGFEDQNVVELLGFISETLDSISSRISDSEQKLKNTNLNTDEREHLQRRLKRSLNQYRIAWGMIEVASVKTIIDNNVRQARKDLNPKVFEASPEFSDTGKMTKEDIEKQIILKKYILNKSHEFFVGTLKFLAL